MVRAKFRVHSKETSGDGGASIKLHPVYNGSEENKEFWKYTPAGEITLYTVNPAAAEQFEVNKEYYVDFTPVG